MTPRTGCTLSSPGEIFKILTPDCTSDGINLRLCGGTLASELKLPGDSSVQPGLSTRIKDF